MILKFLKNFPFSKTCPHTRGDDPTIQKEVSDGEPLSPHAWGWSAGTAFTIPVNYLVLIRVGMITVSSWPIIISKTCPHMRGMILTSLFCVCKHTTKHTVIYRYGKRYRLDWFSGKYLCHQFVAFFGTPFFVSIFCFNTSGLQAYSSWTHFLIILRKFVSFAPSSVFINSPFLYFSTAFLLYS